MHLSARTRAQTFPVFRVPASRSYPFHDTRRAKSLISGSPLPDLPCPSVSPSRWGWQSLGLSPSAPGKWAGLFPQERLLRVSTLRSLAWALSACDLGWSCFWGCCSQLGIYCMLPQQPLVHFCWLEVLGDGGQRGRTCVLGAAADLSPPPPHTQGPP